MTDKVEITVDIEQYRMEMADCISKYKRSFIFMLFLPIPGIFWFIKAVKQKKMLDERRIEIQQKLKDISTEIPFDEYMQMRKRLNSTKTY